MQYIQIPGESQETSELISTKKALVGGAYIVTGKTLAFLASFAVVTVLGRFVPRNVAGSYNFIVAALTIISITTLPGMSNAMTRAVARGHTGSVWPMLRKRLLWGLIGSGICATIATVFWVKGNHTLGLAFLITAPFVPLTDTFSNFTFSFWQGKKRFDKNALTFVIYYFGLALLSIPVFILSDNLLVIVACIMVIQTIMGLLVYTTVKKEAVGTHDLSSEKLGMHLTVMQIFRIISANADRVIAWYLLGPIPTAIYTFAATPVIKAYQLLPIGAVSLPHLSTHEFTVETKRTVAKKSMLLFFITLPIVLCGIILAPFLYKLFFPHYPESVLYFQILIATLLFSPILLIDAALVAFHKTKTLYVTETVSPIVKIILMIIGGSISGLIGMTIGIFIATCFDFLLTLIMFYQTKTVQ